MDFFSKHSTAFNVLAGGLRECQIGGFCAARAHFSTSNDPCLISMPTGSGKTGLMMALSFGFKARRALVISPAAVLRRQIATEFTSLRVLREAKSLSLGVRLKPSVISIDTEVRSTAQWQRYASYDVITATTRTTSPQLKNVKPPPRDFFDVVFVDEAHHEPAETWRALVDSFDKNQTKIILLTGTPYRRDHLPIGGRLSFVYPIARALRDGIYATVNFATAGDPTPATRDTVLARRGIQQFRRLHRSGKPLILVKTDRVAHADQLAELYRSHGLRIAAIHSDQPDTTNESNVDAARKGNLNGLVVVGMMGEGLDIPELKVAVFHRNPQSLPYTLQLIGRLARVPPGLKHGIVVACSSDFTKETFRLYEGTEDWLQLIPQLERQLIGPGQIRSRHSVEDSGAEIELADARPFFAVSVGVRSSRVRKPSLVGETFRTSKGQASVLIDEMLSNDFRAIVTTTTEKPDWLQSHGISNVLNSHYDLHCFYLGKQHILISQTTEDALGRDIQRRLCTVRKLPGYELGRVLSVQDGTYSVIGLQNTTALSAVMPSYKMLLGREAELAVTNADRNSFTPGHGLMKLGITAHSEWRGVAFKNSKVWSLQRRDLGDLREWMRTLENAVLGSGSAVLPKLTLLRRSVPLDRFPFAPIAALWSPSLFTAEITWRNANQIVAGLPAIKVNNSWIGTAGKLSIEEIAVDVNASIKDAYLTFSPTAAVDWTVTVDRGAISTYPLKEFLDEFPLTLLFPDGSSVMDRLYSKPNTEPVIDYNLLKQQIWTGYSITKEIPNGVTPKSVHEYIQDHIALHSNSVAIYDHGTREVADYVEFDPTGPFVCFYHCKGSGAVTPGTRQDDFEELVAQGMACLRRVHSAQLIPRLEERLQNRQARIVHGTSAQWQTAKTKFEPTTWNFRLVLVQPGLSLSKLKTNAGAILRPLLASAADYVQTSGAALEIWCSS
jgi:superfamily II DNA or RNA helicase